MIPRFEANSHDFRDYVPTQNLIDGELRDGVGADAPLEVVNPEAKAEVLEGIERVAYGCALPNIVSGNELEVSRGVTCEIAYAPLGVVAGVVPFDFPNIVPWWMLSQALVGGDAFILKPSEQVPLSALRLGDLLLEAGLPKGVLSIVHGGKEVVEALGDNPDIAALAFAGSTRVAKMVYARPAAAGTRALCLGGAKHHLIVVFDAALDLTAENVVALFTGCAGLPAAREEIFGPVLSILRVPNLDAAIELENANRYGNASIMYTTSGDVARRVMQQVEAGMCGVDIGVPVPREPFGFGGWNDSRFGHGNMTGGDGCRFWTRQRKISSTWALQKDQTWMS